MEFLFYDKPFRSSLYTHIRRYKISEEIIDDNDLHLFFIFPARTILFPPNIIVNELETTNNLTFIMESGKRCKFYMRC
jgi:hypothetical protein